MDLKPTGWNSGYWIHLAQVRDPRRALQNLIINLRVL
jgi:hypothetical protein